MPAPKLNIHCKSLFIVHQGDRVFNLPRDVKIPASKFLKCLLVSKQFLRASQLYNIYEIVIGEFCDNNKFNLRLAHYYETPRSEEFQLTLEELRQLNKLLNVQCADVFKYCYKHANQYSAVSKIFKGKIALHTTDDESENEVHHHEIINQVKDQLFSLRCGAKSLTSSLEIPRLTLLYCSLSKTDNFYQLKQVLTKHQIRKVAISNKAMHSPRFDENIDDDYFDDFPVCPYLKKLEFSWAQLNEAHQLLPKLVKMISFFPNLTEIECHFDAEDHTSEQLSLQQLVDWARKECRKIKELRKERLPTTTIELHYLFRIRRAGSINIVKQAVKQILKTTKFNQLRCFEHIKDEVKDGEDVVPNKEYYGVDVRWREPGFCTSLRFKVELSLSNENEVIEEDDTLLVPLVNCYELD